jgi:hypothetical protein
MPIPLGSRMDIGQSSSSLSEERNDRKTSFASQDRTDSGSINLRGRGLADDKSRRPPPLSLSSKERTTTRQDVGCRKLLRQHMYMRARFLMLARPVRSPLHDVRQHVHPRLRGTNSSILMDEAFIRKHPAGGARRDRTDDLLLAKQALSQLSYGPSLRLRNADAGRLKKWWAWEDLNFRPHAYQARALTN